MSEKLSRRNGVVYVTFENGKCYRLDSVLKRRRAEAIADEARTTTTRRALWWRTHVVSRDLPNSRAANADLSDNGRAAALIRSVQTTNYNMWSDSNQRTNQLPTTRQPTTTQLPTTRQPTTNFYNGRMSKAIAFLCRCQRIKYGSPAHRKLSALLWCVFRNRRTFRRDTLAPPIAAPSGWPSASGYSHRLPPPPPHLHRAHPSRLQPLTAKQIPQRKSTVDMRCGIITSS